MTLPGSHIWLIDPADRLLIFSLDIFSKEDAKRFNEEWKKQEKARGHDLDRVIVSMGETRVMQRDDAIPIPLPPRDIRGGSSAQWAGESS